MGLFTAKRLGSPTRSLPIRAHDAQFCKSIALRLVPPQLPSRSNYVPIVRTKFGKSGALETIGPRERISGIDGLGAVRRFSGKGPWLLRICARRKWSGE